MANLSTPFQLKEVPGAAQALGLEPHALELRRRADVWDAGRLDVA